MSEQVKFYKGSEADLPTSGIEVGAFYHCEDTKNTYRGISDTQLELYSSALGSQQIFKNAQGRTIYVDSYGNHHSIVSDCPYGAKIELHGNNLLANPNAFYKQQVIVGRYNASDTSPFIVGDGTAQQRLNALTANSQGIFHDSKRVSPLIMTADLQCTGSTYTINADSVRFDSSVLVDLYHTHQFLGDNPLSSESNVYMILNQASYNNLVTHPPAKLQLITINLTGVEANYMPVFAGPIQMWNYQLWCTVRGTAIQEDILDQPTYQWDVSITTREPIKLSIDAPQEEGVGIVQDPFPLIKQGLYEFDEQDGKLPLTSLYSMYYDTDYDICSVGLAQDRNHNLIYKLDKSHSFALYEQALRRPTQGIRNYITNCSNTENRPEYNAPVLLGNIGIGSPDEAFSQEKGRYLTSTINKDNPIMADLYSGSISAPGGFRIDSDTEQATISSYLIGDEIGLQSFDKDTQISAETYLSSGSLQWTQYCGDGSLYMTGDLTRSGISMSLETSDDFQIIDITTSGIISATDNARFALGANNDGGTLLLGCNGGANYFIKSHISDNNGSAQLTIGIDNVKDLITCTDTYTQIYTKTVFNDSIEAASNIYTYGAIYTEGDITSEQNIYAQGNINADGTITGDKVYGAVWNDYAEFRAQKEIIEPGYCVTSSNSGLISKTTEKLQACDGIVSDTYGFAIGETDKCQTPLAVAGRVLAYCEGDKNNYNAGDTVCAGPDGKVCKMTREEIREWPDRIIGIVSEIPTYETWGSGNIAVNGRIWIKIK